MELLVEICALQRLFHHWSEEQDGLSESKLAILEPLLERKLAERDQLLQELKPLFPEIDQMSWLQSEDFDA